jgi:hypothetical protein
MLLKVYCVFWIGLNFDFSVENIDVKFETAKPFDYLATAENCELLLYYLYEIYWLSYFG